MKKIFENKKLILIIGGIVFLILSLVLCLVTENEKKEDDIALNITSENITTKQEVKESFYVDIKGYVKNPGVYKMEQGEVINDLIERAGGLKKNSYVKNINLSKKIVDEMVVYVLSNEEYIELTYTCPKCICEKKECNNKVIENNTTKITSSNKTTTKTSPIISTSSVESTTKELTTITTSNHITTKIIETTTKDILININKASMEELMKLDGIGEKTALKIINYRQENLFKTVDDIKNVSGIGDSLFAKIKDFITV